MIKIEEILNIWESDSIIDPTQINYELLTIPKLHSKYLRFYHEHKKASESTKLKFNKMKNIKTEYYLGNLDKESLDEFGWEQFDLKIGTKGNIDRYINADDDLNALLIKKSYHDQAVDICKQIIDQINNRSWQLKSYIEYEKFTNGV